MLCLSNKVSFELQKNHLKLNYVNWVIEQLMQPSNFRLKNIGPYVLEENDNSVNVIFWKYVNKLLKNEFGYCTKSGLEPKEVDFVNKTMWNKLSLFNVLLNGTLTNVHLQCKIILLRTNFFLNLFFHINYIHSHC